MSMKKNSKSIIIISNTREKYLERVILKGGRLSDYSIFSLNEENEANNEINYSELIRELLANKVNKYSL